MSWENTCSEEELQSQKDRALNLEWQSDEVSYGQRQRFCVSEEELTWKLFTRQQIDQECSNLPGDVEAEAVPSQQATMGTVQRER